MSNLATLNNGDQKEGNGKKKVGYEASRNFDTSIYYLQFANYDSARKSNDIEILSWLWYNIRGLTNANIVTP